MRALNQCPVVVQFGQRPQHLHRQEGMSRHRRRTAGVECRLAVGGSVWALWLMVPLKKKAPAEAGGKEGKGAKETRGAGGLRGCGGRQKQRGGGLGAGQTRKKVSRLYAGGGVALESNFGE